MSDRKSDDGEDTPISSPLRDSDAKCQPSKRQLKRQRRHEAYLARRPEMRRLERERRKKRRQQVQLCQITDETIASTRRAPVIVAGLADRPLVVQHSATHNNTDSENDDSAPTIVIDLSWCDHMNDADLAKCAKQIQRCYALQRRCVVNVRLCVSSLQPRIISILQRNSGWQAWQMRRTELHFSQIFAHERVVYLSSESPHSLDQVLDGSVYVIGGLVDHNHLRGVCLSGAQQARFCHARLPIDEHVRMRGRRVLSVDTVCEILLRRAAAVNWTTALCASLPPRVCPQPITTPSMRENEETQMTSTSENTAADGDATLSSENVHLIATAATSTTEPEETSCNNDKPASDMMTPQSATCSHGDNEEIYHDKSYIPGPDKCA